MSMLTSIFVQLDSKNSNMNDDQILERGGTEEDIKNYALANGANFTELDALNDEVLKCRFCPFQEYKFNETKELGFGPRYRIMFVGSSPAVTSNKSAGESKFDYFFKKLLLKVGITQEDFYFTNLSKTSVPSTHDFLTEDESKHCMSHLIKEITIVKPQIIVLLGKMTREAFKIRYPEKLVTKRFKSRRGSIKTKVFSISHPGVLHYHPELETKYLKTLKKALTNYQRILI